MDTTTTSHLPRSRKLTVTSRGFGGYVSRERQRRNAEAAAYRAAQATR